MIAVLFVALLTCVAWSAPVCAGCHREIWDSYRQTGMGRSFYRASPENMVENFSTKNTYYHQPSDSWFTMIQRDGKYYQRRHQLDSAGKPVNVMEKQIDYVMGSGNHARTYLHRTPAGTLIELPLGWYADKGGYWAMNPGYDRPNHEGFRRQITDDCMFCHNAYPPARDAGTLPEGIDCQRCHGSGTSHVKLAGSGAKREEIRKAIVNPARLPTERQMETCMVCHLQTTSFPLPNAIRRYDRGPFSYQPGEPLSDFILNFDHAPGAGREDKFEIASSAYRLRRSACFIESRGKMTCTTCHDPHKVPRGEAATKHYTAVCQQCHSGDHMRQTDCVGCHMPKRRTEDVVHVVMTDHYIQRRKTAGDLLAERPERQDAYRGPVVPHYPPTLPADDLYLAVAQVKQGSNLKVGIPQLEAAIAKHTPARAEFYLDLAEALEKNGELSKALPVYREAARRDPKLAMQKLGTALRRSGQNTESAEVLQRASKLAPGDPVMWHELGLTYRALGRTADAISAIAKALAVDPDMPEAHNNLGIIQLSEASLREAIRINPDYADAHGNLANLLSGAGRMPEARQHFEIALRLRPADAATRYNFAMLLGRTGMYDEAQRELEASVRTDPNFADAHQLLGDLLLAKQRVPDAARHYREALRIQPDSARAHLGLGIALSASGDRAGAISHLQKAAADVATRERATELLRQIK